MIFFRTNASRTLLLGVDSALRRKHESERVSWIASRIESYDVIDMNTSEEVEKVTKELFRTFSIHLSPSLYFRSVRTTPQRVDIPEIPQFAKFRSRMLCMWRRKDVNGSWCGQNFFRTPLISTWFLPFFSCHIQLRSSVVHKFQNFILEPFPFSVLTFGRNRKHFFHFFWFHSEPF